MQRVSAAHAVRVSCDGSGLPQKAGFPQARICECHGSWYDPSNPVVKYTGSLKDHECEWMERETREADLVLVMGTSLGGLFADQVATECAGRALGIHGPPCLGSVIINLQQVDTTRGTNAARTSTISYVALFMFFMRSPHAQLRFCVPLRGTVAQTTEDNKMTLKFSGKSDDILVKLLAALGLADSLPADPKQNAKFAATQCALVPYDASTGMRLPEGTSKPRMWLDLRPGAKIKLIADGPAAHNCQGAKQPNTIHIGSSKGQKFGGKPIPNAGNTPGNGVVGRRDVETCSLLVKIEETVCRLGLWWLDEAASGGPAMLPLVNRSPAFEGSPEPPDPSGTAPSGKATGGRKGGGGGKSKKPAFAAAAASGATRDAAAANVSALMGEYAALGL